MKKAVKSLEKKLKPRSARFLILDGNFKIDIDIPQKSVVKGDGKVFSCAAASILAKVTRDRIMAKYDKEYPRYGFNKHKGYPTKYHFKTLKKYGSCKIHRKTFWPVSGFDKSKKSA
jgi:ribonuclease HII